MRKGGGGHHNTKYYSQWRHDYDYSLSKVPENLPFSNAWIARSTINRLPENSVIHLGILNSLRCWNFFELPKSINAYSDTGGFGIDGTVSALIGATLANPDKLFFGIIGDLAFYYDMNSIGNRHVNKNLRLMIINNFGGIEFKNYSNVTARVFGDDVDKFIAARGHFARESRELLKHYAQDLNFEYLSASNKDEYLANLERFTTPEMLDRPIFFEIFTRPEDESRALWEINNIDVPELFTPLFYAKKAVKKIIGEQNVRAVKKLIGR